VPPASEQAVPLGTGRLHLRWNNLMKAVLPAALIVLILGFSLVDARVLSPENLVNILQQTSYLAIFAMAQMVVLVTRGFDLALGPAVSMVSVAVALAMAALTAAGGYPPVVILLAGLATGFAFALGVGLFNGLIVAIVGVSPFVTTLGSYNIALGIATTLSDGRPVQGVPEIYSTLLYSGTVFGIPAALVIAGLIAVVLHLVLRYTVFGRALYIIGTNERSAVVAGMPTRRILVTAYVLSALLTATGAMMLTARTGSGEPNLGGSLSLQAIAAAVVGGVSLAGGSGGVGTAILGALFVTILSNGMNLARIDGYVQMIVLGAIVILGVVLDRLRLRAQGH
jgi:ribose transport system permease protein